MFDLVIAIGGLITAVATSIFAWKSMIPSYRCETKLQRSFDDVSQEVLLEVHAGSDLVIKKITFENAIFYSSTEPELDSYGQNSSFTCSERGSFAFDPENCRLLSGESKSWSFVARSLNAQRTSYICITARSSLFCWYTKQKIKIT